MQKKSRYNTENIMTTYTMNIPRHDMNLCKLMQAQKNYTKATCSYNHVGGGHVKFAGAKKQFANGEELNTFIASIVAKVMKITKRKKDGRRIQLIEWVGPIYLQKVEIKADSESELLYGRQQQLSRPKLYTKGNFIGYC